MSYSLSNQAEDDVIRIFIAGSRSFGVIQAEKYHDKLEQIFEYLAENPMVNREHFEFVPPIRIHPFESHLVIYLASERSGVNIIRVLHKHEDWRHKPL